MKITIAITAASGSIYAQRLIERLDCNSQIESIHLVLSKNALSVIELETSKEWIEKLSKKVEIFDNNNFYTPIASGSNCDDIMIIIPCSAATLGKIASGISDTLITRSADVILKERRKLILVLRETPYSLIHIENMKTATLAGAIILPASPSFYDRELNIESIILSVVERVEKIADISSQKHKWRSNN